MCLPGVATLPKAVAPTEALVTRTYTNGNVKQMWPMRATAEVRWFSAAYLVPHFAGGLERRILPPCMRSPSGAVYFVTCGGYSLVFI